MPEDKVKLLSKTFSAFAERECKNNSPLYYQLAIEVSKEKQLLLLAQHSRERQPVPNLFFGALHYLLLRSPQEELAAFYPSISKKKSKNIPITLVKSFCKKNEAALIELLQNRIVQTNVINRTAYLMPIFSSLFKKEDSVNLIDIGTSSGLTLNLDLYEYQYKEGLTLGKSKVKISSSILEGQLPKFESILSVKRKIGIDQNPLDLKIADNALWLKALIWPDMLERFQRMEAVIDMAQRSSIEFHKAQTVQEFKTLIDQIPPHEKLIIYHTHVLNQFNRKERKAFRKMLDETGKKHNFCYLAVEANAVFDRKDYTEKETKIELNEYKAGEKRTEILASTNGHGTWIRWA